MPGALRFTLRFRGPPVSDARARLAKCFSSVFPELSDQEIASASVETVEAWDSVMTITLLTVIEEELGIQFEPEALEQLISYKSILDHLTQAARPGEAKSR
jgi:acyl carrier protein